MAVNSYLISEKLDGIIARKLSKCTTECVIKYVTIYYPQITMNRNTAYIILDPEKLPKDAKNGRCLLILLGTTTKKNVDSCPHDCISVDKKIGLGKIYENLQNILEYYNQWEDDMSNVILGNGTLHDLCSLSVPYFGNPLTVQDDNFELIGIGETKDIFYTTEYRQGKSDYLSEKWINSALKNKRNIFSVRGPFEFHYQKEFSSLLFNIYKGDEYIAQICVDACHKNLVVQDYVRICMMAKFVELFLKYRKRGSSISDDQFHSRLLEFAKGSGNRESLQIAVSKHGWKLDDEYLCCCIARRSKDSTGFNGRFFCQKWENLIRSGVCYIDRGKVNLLVNMTKQGEITEDLLEQMKKLAGSFKADIGFSLPFPDFFDYVRHFELAYAAISMGQHTEESSVYCFRDYQLQYVIRNGINSDDLDLFIPSGLKKLMDYDQHNNSDFCKTLYVYLENNQNITETVNQLFLHRSTCKYRIQRIREITGIDLSDPKITLYLHIILTVLIHYDKKIK